MPECKRQRHAGPRLPVRTEYFAQHLAAALPRFSGSRMTRMASARTALWLSRVGRRSGRTNQIGRALGGAAHRKVVCVSSLFARRSRLMASKRLVEPAAPLDGQEFGSHPCAGARYRCATMACKASLE